jgi:hypothetical protein
VTPDRIRFLAPLALLAIAACKESTGLNERVFDEPSTASDASAPPPTAARDAGGITLPPFDFGSLFPQRDAGRPAQPVDAGQAPTSERKRVGPQGGQVLSGRIGLDVPRGAVSRSTEITFAQLPSPPPGFEGTAWLLSPPETRFAVPVRVAIQFTPEQLELAPSNEWAVATLQDGQWVELPNQSTDPGNVFVSAETQTLGAFALILVEPREPRGDGGAGDGGASDAALADASSSDASLADAAVDAGVDVASDAAVDAAVDAGPVTFCQPGACANGTCIEGLTDFGCACNPGFILAPDLHSCADVDECTLGTVACAGGKVCTNTPGSAQCTCPAGTELTPSDTCAAPGTYCLPTSCAPGTCADAAGTFACTCPAGYAGTGTQACADVDECATATATCAANTTCVNTAGSYACQCLPPYALVDGVNCTLPPPVCAPPLVAAGDGTCVAPPPACVPPAAVSGSVCVCAMPLVLQPDNLSCGCPAGTTLQGDGTCLAPVPPVEPPVAPPVAPTM